MADKKAAIPKDKVTTLEPAEFLNEAEIQRVKTQEIARREPNTGHNRVWWARYRR